MQIVAMSSKHVAQRRAKYVCAFISRIPEGSVVHCCWGRTFLPAPSRRLSARRTSHQALSASVGLVILNRESIAPLTGGHCARTLDGRVTDVDHCCPEMLLLSCNPLVGNHHDAYICEAAAMVDTATGQPERTHPTDDLRLLSVLQLLSNC
ncbi:hypothetical protein BDV12DRAFT_161114, partial [Aspergillus spectabilis]